MRRTVRAGGAVEITVEFVDTGAPQANAMRGLPVVADGWLALPTVRQDRGYGVPSALALAVEAVEALSTSSPTVTPGLTAAVRRFERSAL